jgi:hypothetical protein
VAELFSALGSDDRAGRPGAWARRATIGAFGVVVALALANTFGQRPVASQASGPAARLRLSAPETVRGGLFFQSRLDVRAVRTVEFPRIVLGDGWVEGMQVNSIVPAPEGETSRDGRLVLSYGELAAGDLLRVRLQFQVNPTNVGRRSYAVELDDEARPIARVARTITVLP